MELINHIVTLSSHLFFIYFSYHLFSHLFDWEKMIKMTPDNLGRIRIFVVFISVALGYLVSSFFLGIIELSQLMWTVFQ